MATYQYKVLRKIQSADDLDRIPKGAAIYFELPDETAKTPDAAALAAAEKLGETGPYRPISRRHFNETEIVPTTGFAVGDSGSADPPPPAGEGAAEGDIDGRLDPEHVCETEECGHLPGEHGAKGLGICRIDGCPCGKYEPAP